MAMPRLAEIKEAQPPRAAAAGVGVDVGGDIILRWPAAVAPTSAAPPPARRERDALALALAPQLDGERRDDRYIVVVKTTFQCVPCHL